MAKPRRAGHRSVRRLLVAPAIAGLALGALAAAPIWADAAGCAAAPLTGCRVAARGTIDARHDAALPAKNTLRWTWTKGDPTLLPGFGFPSTDASAGESVCVYAANGLVLEAAVPPRGVCDGHPCWTEKTGKSLSYKDTAGTSFGVQRMLLRASAAPKASIKVDAKGTGVPVAALPLATPVTIQLVPAVSGVCFESVFGPETVRSSDATRFKARARSVVDGPPTALASTGCGSTTTYAAGANADTLEHDGLTRSFGVYLPPTYDVAGTTPTPIVIVLHGGFGWGEQVFTNSRMQELADEAGVIVAYPDGVAGPFGVRTWNAGRCCGYAVTTAADDVGFIAALLDRFDTKLCVDDRRVYATGMSNGAMLNYRLGCELSQRIAAIGPVAGSDVTQGCAPTRPVAVMEVHGTADMNVPWEGGLGCGPSGVAYLSVADSIGGWVTRDACSGPDVTYLDAGDGHCTRHGTCPSGDEVVLCAIDGGGHTWPGGLPLSSPGFPGCPFGAQSTTFDATRKLFDFFVAHPRR
jgi:polyhydroxybutyrate depolymerase